MDDISENTSSAQQLAARLEQHFSIKRHQIRQEHLEAFLPPLRAVFPTKPSDLISNAFDQVAPPQADHETPVWGLICETRCHGKIVEVVENVAAVTGAPIQLFHGRENRDFLQNSRLKALIRRERLLLTELNLPEQIGQHDYNRLLLTKRFWELVRARRKVLVFQIDSLCCIRSDFTVKDFLSYDYIGSCWSRDRPIGLKIDGGSGGFSLRDWPLTMACLEHFCADRWPGGEDGFFAFHVDLLGGAVASMDAAARFSTQDFYRSRSFGCHQIQRLPKKELLAFLDYCPEARSVFSLKTGRSAASVSDSSPRSNMFLSHTFRLVYFEVPRTGSNSVSRLLGSLDPQSPTVVERSEAGAGASFHHLPENLLEQHDYRLIATHRNPFDRLWSFWKHRKQNGNPDSFKQLSWVDYVDWACNPNSSICVPNALRDIPIVEMVDPERVDFWLDFHNIEESWAQLSERCSLPTMKLPKINASPDHGPMQQAYSESLAALVIERFRADFEFFQYDTESWRPGRTLFCQPLGGATTARDDSFSGSS
ncbi:MAG: DUF5672 family protein [Pseudomonadota bacterium]